MLNRKEKLREKLLRIVPRANLEDIIDSVREPWHMTRKELETEILAQWTEDIGDDLVSWIKEHI